jgi:hypothetical protein
LYHLKRKGWAINGDEDLKSFDMAAAVASGAEYLISNNRVIDEVSFNITPFVGDSPYEIYGTRLLTLKRSANHEMKLIKP